MLSFGVCALTSPIQTRLPGQSIVKNLKLSYRLHGEKGRTMAKQKVYVICNPRAFFLLGAWLPGWYAGEDDDGKAKFCAHDGVKAFTSKRDVNRVLKNLIPGCYIVEGERDEV